MKQSIVNGVIKSMRNSQINVCYALVCKHICHIPHILLIKNKERAWEIPGGKSEEQDKDLATHINIIKVGGREFHEETGCNLNFLITQSAIILTGFWFEPSKNTIFVKLICNCDAGHAFGHSKCYKFNPKEEKIEKVKWFPIDLLPELSFPTDKKLITDILAK